MGKSLKGKELGKGISQRADGLYVARKMVDGQTISVSGKSLTEVRAKFKEAVDDAKGASGKMTFQKWYEVWFREIKMPTMKCDLSTELFRDAYDNTFPSILGGIRLEEIKQLDVQAAANQMLSDGRGYAAVKIALDRTSQIMKDAIKNGLIIRNPCVGVKLSKATRIRRQSHAIDDWELDLFFEAIKGKVGEEMFKFLIFTGVRVGELSAVKWEDIDFERKVIHIRRSLITRHKNGYEYRFVEPKTESGNREIPFIGGIEKLLIEWKEKRKAIHDEIISLGAKEYKDEFRDLLFVSRKVGRPYAREHIGFMIHRNMERMEKIEKKRAEEEGREPRNIERIWTHLFRHTFATKCFMAGMSPLVVQMLLGHSSYNTTLGYTHIDDCYMSSEIVKLNNVMNF